MNVAHLFARNASRDASSPALAQGARTLFDHRTLARRAASLSAWVAGTHGLRPGDRVAIFMGNRPAYLEMLLGAWWGGFAPVPINAKLHASEVAYQLDHSGSALVVTDAKLAPALATDLPVLVVDGADHRRASETDPSPLVSRGADDLAWLFYTSGTTGRPKGAMITHGNLRAMAYAYFIDIDQIDGRDAILHAAPMSHGSGLYIIPHAAKGAAQVVPESGGFDEAEVFETIGHWPGTTMFAAPTMVKRLVRHAEAHAPDTTGLKTIVYGGAPMYLADLQAAHRCLGYKLAQLYGQGESPMTITALDKAAHAATDHPRYLERLQSAGTAQCVVEVRIGDAVGNALPPGEAGEIMAKGAPVVPGYWNDPEATARAMGDGWLRTGDVGVMDEDGFVTLKDRSKDLIISGGANIYPREVEEVLLLHPGVREASVIGLPDEEWGERVVACIVRSDSDSASVEEAALDALCLQRIARFKRPKQYAFLDELPKSNYGKVLKTELRRRLAPDPGSA